MTKKETSYDEERDCKVCDSDHRVDCFGNTDGPWGYVVHGVLSKGSPSGLNDQGDSYFFSVNSNAKPPLSAGRTVMEPPCNKTAFFTMGSRSA